MQECEPGDDIFIMICGAVHYKLQKLIVCLTGMPGAGKSTIAGGLEKRGFALVSMGDEVREEARRRQLEPTSKNLGTLMIELRQRGGPDAVAALIAPKITSAESDTIVIDGVRSNEEINLLRGLGNLKVLLVHASSDTRFEFVARRGRSDDPKDHSVFHERDEREIRIGISTPIALADESISNNSKTKEELIDEASAIIKNWIKENEAAA